MASPDHERPRILLIDDDTLVLRGMQRLLSDRYDVVTAQGGVQALALLGADQRFDAILCDLMMPSVDGIAVHAALRRDAPQLLERLVFYSGGAATPRAQRFLAAIPNPVLGKPIRAEPLFEVLGQITSRGRSSG